MNELIKKKVQKSRERARDRFPDDSFESSFDSSADIDDSETTVIRFNTRGSLSSTAQLANTEEKFTPKGSEGSTFAEPATENKLTWRNRVNISDDCDSLPAPPPGFYWLRTENNDFILTPMEPFPSDNSEDKKASALILEHVVMPADTLQGICLRYHATALDVRRHNYLSSNAIHHLRILKVPVKPNTPLQLQMNTEDVVTQKFQNVTHESVVEARYYLQDCGYDLDKALAMWKEDEEWCKAARIAQADRAKTLSLPDESAQSAAAAAMTESTPLLGRWAMRTMRSTSHAKVD